MNSAVNTFCQTKAVPINGEDCILPQVWHNLPSSVLADHIIRRGEGVAAATGVTVCRTGKFTGRCPLDRFIVKDDTTADTIDWGEINQPFTSTRFNALTRKLIASLQQQEVYMTHVIASRPYKLRVAVLSTTAYHSLFVRNMFLPAKDEDYDLLVLADPFFTANPRQDGTRNPQFVLLNIAAGILCIGGTGYTGEVKKGIFTLLNYLLPKYHSVLTMHCGANRSKDGRSALFFGLSGTGKTTLSSDPNRLIIGDDEHGWDERGIFNIENGCYAKVINIEKEKEPLIWQAIKPYALLENTVIREGKVDYRDGGITENTRVSYPLSHLKQCVTETLSSHPRDIFFLSCDAFGVLPPLSLLTHEQAIFYFLCGYTAKVGGTEQGIKEPRAVFSSCFASPFIPLRPQTYAAMLKEKLARHNVRVWLVNTGWTGGPYGVGSRINLRHTRALLDAALNDRLDLAAMKRHPIFHLAMPRSCPSVPAELLDPASSWHNRADYEAQAHRLRDELVKQGPQAASLSKKAMAAIQ